MPILKSNRAWIATFELFFDIFCGKILVKMLCLLCMWPLTLISKCWGYGTNVTNKVNDVDHTTGLGEITDSEDLAVVTQRTSYPLFDFF